MSDVRAVSVANRKNMKTIDRQKIEQRQSAMNNMMPCIQYLCEWVHLYLCIWRL